MRLQLQLLGQFRLYGSKGSDIPIAGRKTRALLAFLALGPGTNHSRDALAALLWGDRLHEQARQSLRQELSALRKSLSGATGDPLATDYETAGLKAGILETDVAAFQRFAREATPQALKQAAELYSGPLLDGLRVDAQAFNEWLADQRLRLHAQACSALEELAVHLFENGDVNAAIQAAQRLLRLEPAHEEGHRLLMQLYAAAQRRSDALRQYHTCVDAMRRELDVGPAVETVSLFKALSAGSYAKEPERPPATSEPNHRSATEFDAPMRPAIAVLPFVNLGGDPEQEHFVRGLTADLITDLTRIPQISVQGRGASITDGNRELDGLAVARELGVHYALQGTIRKAGERLRINIRLMDASQGHEIWAERFDRTLDDIFVVQDEIVQNIIAALDVQVIEGEQARMWRRSTQSPEAYEVFLRGRYVWQGALTHSSCLQAKQYMERALAIDPEFTRAMTTMAVLHIYEGAYGWSASLEESLRTARDLAEKAIRIAPSLGYSYTIRALCHLYGGDHARALEEGERAVRINPTGGLEVVFLGIIRTYAGQFDSAIAAILEAIRLTPAYPHWYQLFLGQAYFCAGDYEAAMPALLASLQGTPDMTLNRLLVIATHAALGRLAESRALAADLLRAEPRFSLRRFTGTAMPFLDPADRERVIELAQRAGLPE